MRSSTVLTLIGLAAGAIGFAAASVPAHAGVCQDLWVERNSIYKAYGYCFKTPRAIDYFGNAGCHYDYEADIPLSGRDRAMIADIKRQERSLGCL